MSSHLSREWSGCFSGLLSGSRRQRGSQQALPQEESAILAPRDPSPESFTFVCAIYTGFRRAFRADDDTARIRADCKQLRLW